MKRDSFIQLDIVPGWIAGTSSKPLGIPGRQPWGLREGTGATMAFAASKLSQAIRGEEVG